MVEFVDVTPTDEDLTLAFVNRVRRRLGRPTLAVLAEPDPEQRKQYGNRLARSLDIPVYRYLEGGVFTDLKDPETANALSAIGCTRRPYHNVPAGHLRYDVALPNYTWGFAG